LRIECSLSTVEPRAVQDPREPPLAGAPGGWPPGGGGSL